MWGQIRAELAPAGDHFLPIDDCKAFWEDRFAGNRATYITSNTLQMVFFITASAAWGEGPMDKGISVAPVIWELHKPILTQSNILEARRGGERG